MQLITDFGHPCANVASCLLSLRDHGHLIAEDEAACEILARTLQGCEEAWAREAIAKGICRHVPRFVMTPYAIYILELAIYHSYDLFNTLRTHLLELPKCSLAQLGDESVYSLGRMSLRMAYLSPFFPQSPCMRVIMGRLAVRLDEAADKKKLHAWVVTLAQPAM
jgi:hypothetical protein